MHECKKHHMKESSRKSKIKRHSGRTPVKLTKIYQIEFNNFARALIASIRAQGMAEFQFRYDALKPALQAALAHGTKKDFKYAFSTVAPSVLAHDWLEACALYGLIAPVHNGYHIKILLHSPESAQDYLDHLISRMHLGVADACVFREMAAAFVTAFRRSIIVESHKHISLGVYEELKSTYP
jgi:hypothetical protein